jgi:hypothetical protein
VEPSSAVEGQEVLHVCVETPIISLRVDIRRASGTAARSAEDWVLIEMCSTKFPGHEAGTVRL